ncbi:MAG: carbohydrate ABC transporter permease [Oscillospiraceae bacterium]|jgi:putative aldouronate transport system permease protein|nr:carbohydrate ABC transporter permease [Oscillospiraceae bacterium]
MQAKVLETPKKMKERLRVPRIRATSVRAPEMKKNTAIKGTRSDRIFDAVNLVVWIVLLFIILYPLYLIVISSVSDPTAIHAGKVLFLPVDFSLMGYEAVFAQKEIWNSYLNSIFYTVVGSGISVAITLAAAYALTRKFIGKSVVNFIFIFTMFFNGGLIPTFLTMRDMHLYNTRTIMIIINCVSVWNLMIARTYISSTVPNELYEAAVIDGSNHFRYFFKMVLPLSGTIIAVLCVYYGVSRWNDYFTALVYIRNRALLPLQTILREVLATLTTSTTTDSFFDAYEGNVQGMVDAIRKAEVAKYCCIVISTGPAVVLYVFMQKYFVKGVMIGSLKG